MFGPLEAPVLVKSVTRQFSTSDGWTDGRTGGRTGGRADGRADGRTDGRINPSLGEGKNGRRWSKNLLFFSVGDGTILGDGQVKKIS